MNIEQFRDYCLSKKSVTEDAPFGEDWVAYRVGGKIFALIYLKDPVLKVNLKHQPEENIDLRERYPEIEPDYHMNKRHWNTVNFEGNLRIDFLKELIDHSYQSVIENLSKTKREKLGL